MEMGTPRYKAAMLAIDRLLNEIDDAPSKERAAILHALIENQEAILTDELQQYRTQCENLFWSAQRLTKASSPAEIHPDDWRALKLAVAESSHYFQDE